MTGDERRAVGFGTSEAVDGATRSGAAALHAGLDRAGGSSVAIELLDAQLAGDPAMRDRLSAIARLKNGQHPNLPKIEAVSESSQGCPYVVTEQVEGQALSALIAQRAPLSADDAVAILLQIVLGVEHLHEQGMTPLGLRPDGIVVDVKGYVTLLPSSLLPPAADAELYRAPEEIGGAASGRRADVYRLGLIAYEILAGRPPFSGAGEALAEEQLHAAPPPLIGINTDLPGSAVRAVQRALAKQPSSRPSDAAAFADLLLGATPEPVQATETAAELSPALDEAALAVEQPELTHLVKAEAPREPVSETAPAEAEGTTRRRRRRGWLWQGLALLGVLIVAAAIAVLVVRARHTTTSTTGSAPATPTSEAAGSNSASTAPIAATPTSAATASPAPTLSELTVCDDVFACKQTDFVASTGLAVCFVLNPAPGGLDLVAVITAGSSPPAGVNAPEVIAHSAPIAGDLQRSCYVVALPAAFPPGAHTMWVLDGSQILGQRAFTTIAP